jgi:hypothetical protein
MTDTDARARWRAGTSRQVTPVGEDGHVVRVSRRYEAPVADVWDAWTNPESGRAAGSARSRATCARAAKRCSS